MRYSFECLLKFMTFHPIFSKFPKGKIRQIFLYPMKNYANFLFWNLRTTRNSIVHLRHSILKPHSYFCQNEQVSCGAHTYVAAMLIHTYVL
jgi:hypothetical protein